MTTASSLVSQLTAYSSNILDTNSQYWLLVGSRMTVSRANAILKGSQQLCDGDGVIVKYYNFQPQLVPFSSPPTPLYGSLAFSMATMDKCNVVTQGLFDQNALDGKDVAAYIQANTSNRSRWYLFHQNRNGNSYLKASGTFVESQWAAFLHFLRTNWFWLIFLLIVALALALRFVL